MTDLQVDFVAQHGPYADLTSVINGFDHLNAAAHPPDPSSHLFVAFSDNLYPGTNPLLALRQAPGPVAVLARPYQRELAGSRGVVVATPAGPHRHMITLFEKPTKQEAETLGSIYGSANLMLLEGRVRLSVGFVDFARAHPATAGREPKLALTLRAYARTHPVLVLATAADVVDLGEPDLTRLLIGRTGGAGDPSSPPPVLSST